MVGVRWRAAERDQFEQFVIEEAIVPAVEGPAKTPHHWPRDYTRSEAGSTEAVAVARAVDTLPGILLKLVIRAESESRLLVSIPEIDSLPGVAAFRLQTRSRAYLYVRNQLQKRETYVRLTPVAKAKCTKLLDYNWHDCNGLREVVLTAAGV